MVGWTRKVPKESGWHRVVIQKNGNQTFVEFAYYIYATEKFKVAGQEETLYMRNKSEDEREILFVWSEPELKFTEPYEKDKNYCGMDDLSMSVDMALEAIQSGDMGMVWNIVGREFHDNKDGKMRMVKIKGVNVTEGRIDLEHFIVVEKPAEFIKLKYKQPVIEAKEEE